MFDMPSRAERKQQTRELLQTAQVSPKVLTALYCGLTLVLNLVDYAHKRDMKIVAEGLENAAELKKVLELGVDLLQGFYLARPMAEPAPVNPAALSVIAAFHNGRKNSN